eukprot:s3514_g11.t1
MTYYSWCQMKWASCDNTALTCRSSFSLLEDHEQTPTCSGHFWKATAFTKVQDTADGGHRCFNAFVQCAE